MKAKRKNLRKEERKDVEIPLGISTVHVFTESQIVNISEGGLFINTPRPLPKDADIEIEFVLPRADKKYVPREKVKWAIDTSKRSDGKAGIVPGMGIKFIEISKENLKKISSYIKK